MALLPLTVAGYQMPVTSDVAANARAICSAVDRAAEQGAEILLTPEGSLSGYAADFDVATCVRALAEVTSRAREQHLGLALGTCFVEADGRCYNQLRFYDPEGGFLGFHAKQLLCASLETPPEGEVNDFATAPLCVFPWGGALTIGGLICNDLWANPQCTPDPDPHLTQSLSRMGATVVFHAVNGGRDEGEWTDVWWHYHETNLRARARAAGSWIVTVDNAAPVHRPCSAPSGVIDPEGRFVVRASRAGEDLFVHTLEGDDTK